MINSSIDFLKQIFIFFKKEYTENELRFYNDALSVKYPVDWDKLFRTIVRTTEKRVLPMPKYFADMLPQYKKITEYYGADEGCTIRIYFDKKTDKNPDAAKKNEPPQITYYDFVVTNFEGATSLKDIKKRAESIDENGVKSTSIRKIIKYPKGVTLIGEQVFYNVWLPDNLSPEETLKRTILKEQELKAQVKVLFQREDVE